MALFRVIVIVGGERTVQVTLPFERAPTPGETIAIPGGQVVVTVRHVIEAGRNELSGIVLAWAGD